MRIMLVNTYYAPEIIGGAEVFVCTLAEHLVTMGHEVIVLCTGDRECVEHINGVLVIRIRANRLYQTNYPHRISAMIQLHKHVLNLYHISNAKALKRIIRSYKPNIIHTNNLYRISQIIWTIAKRERIPVVHTVHDSYLFCPRLLHNCVLHGKCDDSCIKSILYKVVCKFHRYVNAQSLFKPNSIVLPSEAPRKYLLQLNESIRNRIHIINHGIDYNAYSVQSLIEKKNRIDYSQRSIRFAYLGKLSEQKGIQYLIEAFSTMHCEHATLWIAGNGDYEFYVNNICDEHENIHFVGWIKSENIDEFLADMDVLICPSIWEETFGMVVLEAYRNGLPIIATRMGAFVQTVDNNHTGFLIKPESTKAIQDAVLAYVNNPSMLKEHRKSIPNKLQSYSIDHLISEYISLYNRMIAKNVEK